MQWHVLTTRKSFNGLDARASRESIGARLYMWARHTLVVRLRQAVLLKSSRLLSTAVKEARKGTRGSASSSSRVVPQ